MYINYKVRVFYISLYTVGDNSMWIAVNNGQLSLPFKKRVDKIGEI